MTEQEFEVSYMFDVKTAEQLQERLPYLTKCTDAVHHYLTPDTRVSRILGKNERYVLNAKRGKKSSGVREESETEVNADAFDILSRSSLLKVMKRRYHGKHPDNGLKVSIDFVSHPLKVAILEIESNDELVTDEMVEGVVGAQHLLKCPLSAYEYFRRKVGICGAPSSGKTETAKQLSYLLNTKYGANSFHVTEYATSFIQKYGHAPTLDDEFFIWNGQRDREEKAGKNANILISDCPTFLPYLYALVLNEGSLTQELAFKLTKLYKRCVYDAMNYTDLFFMRPMGDYVTNGVRYGGTTFQKNIDSRIALFLNDHGIPHTETNYHSVDNILNDLLYLNTDLCL